MEASFKQVEHKIIIRYIKNHFKKNYNITRDILLIDDFVKNFNMTIIFKTKRSLKLKIIIISRIHKIIIKNESNDIIIIFPKMTST